MSYTPRYDRGDWLALCDICGRKYKASTLRKRWDGFMCCPQDWEIRQPQDFVKGVSDVQIVPWVRDEPADTFVVFCNTNSSLPGYATAGCAIAANTAVPADLSIPPSSFTP